MVVEHTAPKDEVVVTGYCADGIDLHLFECANSSSRTLFALEAATRPEALPAEQITAGGLVGDVGKWVCHGRYFSTNGLGWEGVQGSRFKVVCCSNLEPLRPLCYICTIFYAC